jgi:hypothetical protein
MVGMSNPNTYDDCSFYPLFALYPEAFKNGKKYHLRVISQMVCTFAWGKKEL